MFPPQVPEPSEGLFPNLGTRDIREPGDAGGNTMWWVIPLVNWRGLCCGIGGKPLRVGPPALWGLLSDEVWEQSGLARSLVSIRKHAEPWKKDVTGQSRLRSIPERCDMRGEPGSGSTRPL